MIRITQSGLSNNAIYRLHHRMGEMQKAQDRLALGKNFARTSDAPPEAIQSMQFKSAIRRSEQFVRNSDDGADWLSTADSTIGQMVEAAGRAYTIGLSGASDGAMDQQARNAIANEVAQIRDQLTQLGNFEYRGRRMFAGADNGLAFNTTTGAYEGDDAVITRTVAPGINVQVNITGRELFGATDATNILATLDELEAHLRSGTGSSMDTLRSTDMPRLQAHIRNLVNRQAEVGARHNQIEALRDRADDDVQTLKASLSTIEDVDLPTAIVQMQMQEVAYTAALQATAKIIQPSLADFLR